MTQPTVLWDIGLEYPDKSDPLKSWPDDPDIVVHVFPRESKYDVAVEIQRPADGPSVVSGVAIRTTHMLSGAGEPRPISPREIQRLPLARIVRAAAAAAATAPTWDELPSVSTRYPSERLRIRGRPDILYYDHEHAVRERFPDVPWLAATKRKLAVPRGRPQRGKSAKFYLDILAKHDDLAAEGYASPVKAIARQKGVSENTVHQWLYRARHNIERSG
jgi:hypothetical protein